MASLIHELENNEAMLLMYALGELPPDDRLEVEQMLASDAGLRTELARIRSAHDAAMTGLAVLDQNRSALPAENHAVRQAMRAMEQWQADRLHRQPVVVPPPRMHIAGWMYPLGSIAALLIGTIAWWGFSGAQNRIAVVAPSIAQNEQDPATIFGSGLVRFPTGEPPSSAGSPADEVAMQLRTSLTGYSRAGDPSNSIADAEREAQSLVARSDGAGFESSISIGEPTP